MKTRNAFATLTIYVLSALTILDFVSLHKVQAESIVEAESIRDCRKLVTGTYLTTLSTSTNFGRVRGIITFNRDGNFVTTASIQSGVPNIPPFSNVQGSWKCTSSKEVTATGLDFNYSTATVPGSITRSDFRATFAPKDGIVQATATLRSFDLNANPLKDYAPVQQTFTFTGQRIKP
ncbi:MAG: hypothetical protein V7L26_31960 [Nostoc sp.]|uniref:hypothetical protein n=1 Tax=Nostoc sp. TaxID=1180 RepID=UPI002FF47923